MKLFILTDMEGVSGIADFERQCVPGGARYEEGRRLLTGEVNAAVEAALENGFDEFLVWDGHGAGGVSITDLHPSARLIHGTALCARETLWDLLASCDAAMIVGQHAMSGAERACLNHTQLPNEIIHYKLNGRLIGEIGQFVLTCGFKGVPVIFLGGDHAACREIEALSPGVVTAAVKEGLSRTYAISLPPQAARELIGRKVSEAIAAFKKGAVKPVVWEGPFVLEKKFFRDNPTVQQRNAGKIGFREVDAHTVQFESDNLLDVLWA